MNSTPPWRRPKPTTPTRVRAGRALTAAGARIDLDQVTGRQVTATADWQKKAWAYRDSLGEIRYAMAYLAYAVSRCRIFPAVITPGDDDPVPLDEQNAPGVSKAIVDSIVDSLTSGTGVWSEIVPTAAHCMEIAGEAVLVGYPDPMSATGETWHARSVDELQRTDRGWRLIDSPGREGAQAAGGIALGNDVFVGRLWHPHPRWRGVADSPMRALLDTCEELKLISRDVRGTARSRIASAGVLAVPDGLDFPGSEDFLTALTQLMTSALGDEASATNVVPGLIKGDGDLIAKIQHITLARPLDASLLDRENAALRRLATGLDVPPEVVTGIGDLNHWSAWAVDAATIKMHVEPLLVRVLDAVTAGAFRPLLLAEGVSPQAAATVCLWYSVDPLTVRPNRSEDADAAWDRHAISWEAYRDAKGFGEEDAPSDDELAARLALARGTVDTDMLRVLLTEVMRVRLSEPPAPPAPIVVQQPTAPAIEDTPPGDAPADPNGTAPAAPTPRTTPGPTTAAAVTAAAESPEAAPLQLHRTASERLARIDTDTRERLAAAVTAAVNRAVERATNRARGAAQRDPRMKATVAAAPPGHALAVLGREALTAAGVDLGDLLTGAWDGLRDQWAAATAQAWARTVTILEKVTGEPVDPARHAAVAETTANGWAWLEEHLNTYTTTVLFDPDSVTATTTEVGEDDGLPGRATTLTRGALTLAGGPTGDGGGVRPDGTLIPEGTPSGGIATGGHATSHLTGHGVGVVGYEWVYGVSRNVFEPHHALDGLIVSGFTSPALAHSGWPGPVLAPGDHAGCHCDLTPILGDLPGTAVLQAAGDATYDPAYMDVLRQIAVTDRAEGRDTTITRTVAEADRVAASRPSQRRP